MRTLALGLSFSVGFLSLSQEILWVRLAAHGHGGRPFVFSWILAAFLVGIAAGAVAGRRLCARADDLPRAAGQVLMFAAIADSVALLVAPFALHPAPVAMLMLFGLVALCAMGKAVVFPLAHHMGSSADGGQVGRSVSRVYFANVLGATLGPVVTGFVLLDMFTATQVFLLIIAATMAVGLAFARVPGRGQGSAPLTTVCALALVVVVLFAHRDRDVIAMTSVRFNGGEVERVLQGRHGVIHTVADREGGGAITLGGNVYDGRIEVDMDRNANGLDRAYLMAMMHPSPRRVLVIGMSTGAWTRAIAGFPGVEHVDVVEINPAYIELVAASPAVASILRDPRVHIHVDDGRRWLRAHPEKQYDLIFQNTTFHWRANVSMLLSREYFTEAGTHLGAGGIMAVNTTQSLDVYATALAVFPQVIRYQHFAYMSHDPIRIRSDAAEILRKATLGGRTAFSADSFERGIAAQLLAYRPQSAREFLRSATAQGEPGIITDLNALTEYRHGLPSPFAFLQAALPTNPNAGR